MLQDKTCNHEDHPEAQGDSKCHVGLPSYVVLEGNADFGVWEAVIQEEAHGTESEKSTQNTVEHEEQEELVVAKAYASADPRAVMVHS